MTQGAFSLAQTYLEEFLFLCHSVLKAVPGAIAEASNQCLGDLGRTKWTDGLGRGRCLEGTPKWCKRIRGSDALGTSSSSPVPQKRLKGKFEIAIGVWGGRYPIIVPWRSPEGQRREGLACGAYAPRLLSQIRPFKGGKILELTGMTQTELECRKGVRRGPPACLKNPGERKWG